MKIREQDIPQLRLLNITTPVNLNIPESVDKLKVQMTVNRLLIGFGQGYRDNIYYITEVFAEAAERSRDRILIPDLIKKVSDECGVMIYRDIKNKKGSMALFYYISSANSYSIFNIHEFNGILHLVNLKYVNSSGNHIDYKIDDKFPADRSLENVMLMLLFKKFAKVETVFTKPDERKYSNGENYKNLTKSNITFLDSKWFREIVNSNSFGVSGHFRLQPCGVGRKDRELIYINEFVKNGYHRKAKVENEQ